MSEQRRPHLLGGRNVKLRNERLGVVKRPLSNDHCAFVWKERKHHITTIKQPVFELKLDPQNSLICSRGPYIIVGGMFLVTVFHRVAAHKRTVRFRLVQDSVDEPSLKSVFHHQKKETARPQNKGDKMANREKLTPLTRKQVFFFKVLLLIKFVHMFDQKGLENCTCYQFLGYCLVK